MHVWNVSHKIALWSFFAAPSRKYYSLQLIWLYFFFPTGKAPTMAWQVIRLQGSAWSLLRYLEFRMISWFCICVLSLLSTKPISQMIQKSSHGEIYIWHDQDSMKLTKNLEMLSDFDSSSLSQTNLNKLNLEITLGRPHWIYIVHISISINFLVGICHSPWKLFIMTHCHFTFTYVNHNYIYS